MLDINLAMPSSVAVDPIHVAHSKHSGIGAVLDNINIEDPSEAELEEIRQALGKYHVICIRKKTLSPEMQIALAIVDSLQELTGV